MMGKIAPYVITIAVFTIIILVIYQVIISQPTPVAKGMVTAPSSDDNLHFVRDGLSPLFASGYEANQKYKGSYAVVSGNRVEIKDGDIHITFARNYVVCEMDSDIDDVILEKIKLGYNLEIKGRVYNVYENRIWLQDCWVRNK